ncbi:conserved hypothetical protein [Treponema primitia ZAS-2]|uniref:PD-(D/E)XK endonuclease-like domain-containing protein n=1 Tax=Treponema primitia (strain ATCC BAA-887 / DSM 12427 / ZAS-2) TaxID=545694 RepID=F5YPP5_TREPZ|nr:PD-(D/E)XK nuclease family protein [Treponema primitia]AEF85616.1 conserved hypothetical protein [Treponema primitia ZAS-2]
MSAETQYNHVESILLKNIDDPTALFVFPTDIAVSHWVDQLLTLRGGGTVAMDQFTAWDTFKQESIRAQKQDKKSVPAVLRKIFVSRLIQENSELYRAGGAPLFTFLIPPEYAYAGASFVSWFTRILPQLGSWFEKTSGVPVALINEKNGLLAGEGLEGDDRDLYTLALRYQQFLDAHGLFEPAWEKPPFEDTGKKCFIFFPESLMDYSEYAELLENTGHVTPVRVSAGSTYAGVVDKPYNTFFYTNSRREISEAALYIRGLHEKQGVPFESIVVSIPDTENYEPYVLREFTNRNIPFVRRAGKPLASYAAGQLFATLSDCASRDFPFDAIAGLLLNRHLPWKDNEVINQLINFGIRNNCITSWKEADDKGTGQTEIHVWEDAFKSPMGNREERARLFYESLKGSVEKLCSAVSFADLRNRYFVFREKFLNMDECLPETDLILSRCVSELLSLIEIEKSFPDIIIPDPYTFFVEYLQEKNYLPQQYSAGVTILPYRTAAPVPFGCHIILGSTQDNLSTVFSRLGFLSRAKREELGLKDDDASEAFINLHKLNSSLPAVFFCAQETFAGYAIPHSRLNVTEKPRMRYGEGSSDQTDTPAGIFEADLFDAEREFYLALQTAASPAFPHSIHQGQSCGFNAWAERRSQDGTVDEKRWKADQALLDLIGERYCYSEEFPGKFSVSASSLEPYYNCALVWLFQRVLNLENIRIETSLMAENIMGSVYHAILNCFFEAVKKDGSILSRLQNGFLPHDYSTLLTKCIQTIFDGLPALLPRKKPEMSALTVRLIRAGKKSVGENLERLLTAFLSFFSGYRIIGSETSWKSDKGSYYLNGTVDCMLEAPLKNTETRGTVIVDFKLFYMPDRNACTAKEDDGLTNFQLPLYMTLAEDKGGKPVDTALFFSIVKAAPQVLFGVIENSETGDSLPKAEGRILRTGAAEDQFRLIMDEFREKADRYAAEISTGNFSTFSNSFRKCVGCSYQPVCRTSYAVDRESNLLKWSAAGG